MAYLQESSLELLDWYDLQRLCEKRRLRFTAAGVCGSWTSAKGVDE